jgi:hypothetical protein
MSDVRQKAKDLLKLALQSDNKGEREAATVQLLKLIDRYDLLSAGGKPINVAAEILNRVISGDFMEEVAGHVEKAASTFERVMAAGKRITDARGPSSTGKRRKRTYR